MESKKSTIINQIPGLIKSQVKITNYDDIDRKLKKMAQEGPDSLQVIFDFDKTLTDPTKSRKPIFSSLEVFQEMEKVPEWFKTEIEVVWSDLDKMLSDPTQPKLRKVAFLYQTFEEFVTRLAKFEIDNIADLITNESVRRYKLRENVNETFSLLKQRDVFVSIISAGIGQVVTAVLQANRIDTQTVLILANYLRIVDGKIDGLMDDLIHVFNKNEQALRNPKFNKETEKRQNIIVIGDSIADAHVAASISTANVLSIGFLNYNVEQELKEYREAFDIVIIEDSTMNVVNDILKKILIN